MKRELHALILGLAGAALAKLALTGAYTRYVRPGLRPFLLAAAAVLVAVALASLWRSVRLRAAASAGGAEHGHHHHGRFDVAWLLVVPMLAALLIAPPALSSFSAARAGTALGAAAHSDLPPLPSDDPVRLSMLDYASRAVFDHGRSLTGRHLTLSGFLVPDGHDSWYLTRMVITCCAADAQPIKVGMSGPLPAGLHANDWIEVTGAYVSRRTRDAVNGGEIPFVQVANAKRIPTPEQQYVS